MLIFRFSRQLICDIAALCDPELKEYAETLDIIAECFYCSLQACMVVQVRFSFGLFTGEMHWIWILL